MKLAAEQDIAGLVLSVIAFLIGVVVLGPGVRFDQAPPTYTP